MRAMLVRARVSSYLDMKQRRLRLEHLGLAYLAACLRQQGHTVEIVDADLQELDQSQVTARLTEGECDLVGLTMPDAVSARAVVELLTQWEPPKKRGRRLHLTVGGRFATLSPKEVLAAAPDLDSVVLYEGEETLAELAARLAENGDWRATPGIAYEADGRFHESGRRPPVAQLDELPFPARDTLPALLSADPNAVVSVLSSRGCHRRCTFCSVGWFSGRWRPRSAGNVVDELEALTRDFGVRRVDFQDDNFIGPGERGRARAMAIAEEIRRRGLDLRFRIMCSTDTIAEDVLSRLMEAGLFAIFLGVESGSQTRLTAYRKGTVEQNIRALEALDRVGLLPACEIGFIMFDPDGSLKEIEENLDFLRKHVPFITPSTLLNSRSDTCSDIGVRPPLALPEPLHSLSKLFALINVTTQEAFNNLRLSGLDHTEAWRVGILDVASYALTSLSELADSGRLTDETRRTLTAEVKCRAEALSSSIASLQTAAGLGESGPTA